MTKARSNATANAAKGDLTVGNGTNLSGVLGVGSNGDTIVADSSTSTGLRYTAGNPIANPVLNSCFDIWQRGTSISLGASASYLNGFLADRWQTSTSGGQASTITRQATGDTTNLPNIQYCLRYQRNAGQTGTAAAGFYQSFESTNSIPFVGKTVTFSFYARAGANFSPTSNFLQGRLYSGTGTDQTVFAYSGLTSVINTTAALTTTWQRFTGTATISATATEIALGFEWVPTGTAGAADYFEVTGVQLDIGSVALPVRRNSGTIQGELAACQRYYYRATSGNAYRSFASAFSNATTTMLGLVPFPVTMRTPPTALEQSGTASEYGIQQGATGITCSAVPALSNATIYNSIVQYTVASGLTIGQAGLLRNENNATAYLAWSAEL